LPQSALTVAWMITATSRRGARFRGTPNFSKRAPRRRLPIGPAANGCAWCGSRLWVAVKRVTQSGVAAAGWLSFYCGLAPVASRIRQGRNNSPSPSGPSDVRHGHCDVTPDLGGGRHDWTRNDFRPSDSLSGHPQLPASRDTISGLAQWPAAWRIRRRGGRPLQRAARRGLGGRPGQCGAALVNEESRERRNHLRQRPAGCLGKTFQILALLQPPMDERECQLRKQHGGNRHA
jgi:hypothetical protein